jgi:hypothetical protein
MKHPYTVGCACNRCEKEKMRRNAQSKANQRPANQCSRKARQVRSWNDWHGKGNEFDIQCD